ncbi:hypothetical protein CS006_08645 [Bifidobacterium primatium]|uniref:YdbS-like PH domain-containing protein n=1 Tax=Bifidobacterium primatium TaxID=2045438 RepID=A0A2M9H744_9BIFI|nr:PH domain-containing protein [Bifidobacterium primatium]PJM72629.1 hypothetical protein CS006_08645 [Bifidobacterium primatium]
MTGEQTDPRTPHASGAWHRTHPLALVIDVYNWGKAIIGFVFSMLVILPRLHMTFRTVCMLAAGIILMGVVWLIAEWASRRYRLERDALTLRTGLFTDTRKTIPYDHIHAVDVSAPFFFRPFALVTLTVDSGGVSDGSTITLTAVPATLSTTLERLRRQACGPAPHDPAAHARQVTAATDLRPAVTSDTDTVSDTRERLVFRASIRDTLLFAVTDLGFLAALAVITGFLQNLRDIIPRDVYDSTQDSVIRFSTHGALHIVVMVIIVVAAMLTVSIVKSLAQYHRFEVWRRGDDLVVVRGLFTRRSATVPVRRVQSIIIRRSLLRRLLHLSSVQVGLTTPGTGDSGDDVRGAILPVIADARLYGVLRAMLPEWHPAPPRVRRTARGLGRYLMLAPLMGTLAGMGAVAAAAMIAAGMRASREATGILTATFDAGWGPLDGFRVIWLLWLVLIPAVGGGIICVRRLLQWRTEGYALLPGNRIVVTGARGLGLVTMITRRSRIQYVRRRMLPWRMRAGVESMVMPLFVMNGHSCLRLAAIRSAEAQRLHDWAVGCR